MRKRTRARELALQYLYSIDGAPEPPDDAHRDDFIAMQTRDDRIAAFARDLIAGVVEHRARLDDRIGAAATRWDLSRIATVDRNVLRLGAYELWFRDDIPAQVTINEAIELAKRYSTAASGGFVNGLLDSLRVEAERSPIDATTDEVAPEPDGETTEGDGDEEEDDDDLPAAEE